MIPLDQLTGILLAGGAGRRMGGVDKGLQPLGSTTLAAHAVARLRPQVGHLMISANRHVETYQRFGHPVLRDAATFAAATEPEHRDGPLAGILAGLQATTTPFVAIVPCDAPFFPTDLVAVLGSALLGSGRAIALAATRSAAGAVRTHPVFAVMRRELAADLAASLATGERRVGAWYQRHSAVEVTFADERAFYNVNTLQALSDIDNP